jgi:hypothetical protein
MVFSNAWRLTGMMAARHETGDEITREKTKLAENRR